MSEDERLNLDGVGFDREPLTPEEVAKHRHMRHHYERNFLESDKFIEKLGIAWIVALSKAAPVLVKVIGGMAVLGAAMAWASEKGLF